ncbi:MAG: hypothetical protein NXI30_25930 [bacterium]|nr:hypothetical protein [bacterium]
MRKRADQPTDQAEFTFSSDFRRPRGVPASPPPARQRAERRSPPPRSRPLSPSLSSSRPPEFAHEISSELPRTPRRRRGVAPASRRLAISPEAFGGSESDAWSYGGAVEVAVAILATMAFGLGWAAYELDFELPSAAPSAQSSATTVAGDYALIAPTTPFGLAGAEEAEWTTTNGDARGFTPTDDSSAR